MNKIYTLECTKIEDWEFCHWTIAYCSDRETAEKEKLKKQKYLDSLQAEFLVNFGYEYTDRYKPENKLPEGEKENLSYYNLTKEIEELWFDTIEIVEKDLL